VGKWNGPTVDLVSRVFEHFDKINHYLEQNTERKRPLDLYLGGYWFESQPGTQVTLTEVSWWLSSDPSRYYWNNSSMRPPPFHLKSFPITHSSGCSTIAS
jgi:hypothetical protein